MPNESDIDQNGLSQWLVSIRFLPVIELVTVNPKTNWTKYRILLTEHTKILAIIISTNIYVMLISNPFCIIIHHISKGNWLYLSQLLERINRECIKVGLKLVHLIISDPIIVSVHYVVWEWLYISNRYENAVVNLLYIAALHRHTVRSLLAYVFHCFIYNFLRVPYLYISTLNTLHIEFEVMEYSLVARNLFQLFACNLLQINRVDDRTENLVLMLRRYLYTAFFLPPQASSTQAVVYRLKIVIV